MKKSIVICAVFTLACFGLVSAACAQEGGEAEAAAAAPADHGKASYGIGYNMGKNMKSQEVAIDLDAMIAGLRDGLAGGDAKYSDEELQAALSAFQQEMMSQQQERAAAEAAANLSTGKAFLEKNGQRPEVKTTASGLQYEVLEEGTGDQPTANDKVVVQYKGMLVDGTVFDSSYQRNEPATFGVGQVIPGFSEGLQLMKEGAKYKLYIPADIAYGSQSRPGLPGNSTLIFEVELLDVNPPAAAGETPAATPQGAQPDGGR